MCYYFGILVLTVFSIGLVESQCKKDDAEKILTELKGSSESHVALYQRMEREYTSFGQSIFDCEDDAKLYDAWDKLEDNLLNKIKKTCPDFEKSYREIQLCRENLDDYYFGLDHVKYCSTFRNCSERHRTSCSSLKESVLLYDRMSNASVNFCTIKCDDIPNLRRIAANCWGGAKSEEQSSSKRYELFSDCLLNVIRPTCRITKEMIFRILPLFQNQSSELISTSEKPDIQCIKEWKALEKIEHLKPNMCRMLERGKACISESLNGNDKRLKEQLAKCQYSVVNLIRTEALVQPTETPTQSPSTASGNLGSGTYHFAVICWLVTMVLTTLI